MYPNFVIYKYGNDKMFKNWSVASKNQIYAGKTFAQ